LKIKTIAIIGAGIIGVTTAYQLTKSGYKVILIDAEDGVALRTSFANGGQLSYSYIDAMASPSLLKKLPSILLGRDPTFRVRFSPDPKFLAWGSRFMFNAQAAKEEQNTGNNLRLSLYSRKIMQSLCSELALDFEHRKSGKLHIYSTAESLEKAKARVEQKGKWGCPQEILNTEQCLALEPKLAQLDKAIAGGVYSSIDEVGNVHKFANHLLKTMQAQQTLETHFNTKVAKIVKKDKLIDTIEVITKGKTSIIKADAYVLATASDSLNLSKDIGLKLPIYPIKGYSITVPATDSAPDVCVTDMDHKMVFARIGDRLRIAGLADIVAYDDSLDESRLKHLLTVAKKVFPKAGNYDEILHKWTGFRPATPSSVPIIGQVGADNLYLNLGHGMFGWTLAMGSAALLTSIINQETPPIDTTGMRPIDHGVV